MALSGQTHRRGFLGRIVGAAAAFSVTTGGAARGGTTGRS